MQLTDKQKELLDQLNNNLILILNESKNDYNFKNYITDLNILKRDITAICSDLLEVVD